MSSIDYPPVVFQEIAKRLDYKSIQSMKLTNRHVYAALSDDSLWIDLCARDKCLPSKDFRESLAKEAAKNKLCAGELSLERIWALRRNLVPPMLPTLDAMEEKYGWTFSPRHGVTVEEPPIGTDPHPDVTRCFATTHYLGGKHVKINLVKKGVPEWVLDHIRPRIIVSEMVAPRNDAASKYKMRVQLHSGSILNAYNFLLNCNKRVWMQWPQFTNPAVFERVEIIFDDYPIGIREVEVHSEGVDLEFWRGHYGAKFANLEIRIEMPDKFRWLDDGTKKESEGRRTSERIKNAKNKKNSDYRSSSISAPQAKRTRKSTAK